MSEQRPWPEVFGIQCLQAIGLATGRRSDGKPDGRVAYDYHENSAWYLAKKAAHAAFRLRPDLKSDDAPPAITRGNR